MLDKVRQNASQNQEKEAKLLDTISMQARALASQKSTLRRYLEYALLVVCLGLAVRLVYTVNQLRLLLGS